MKGLPLTVGDRVLLANRGERGKRKIADKWESKLYEVMSVRSPINVYRIRDTETGREKTVHRNLLLPVNFLYKDDGTALPSQSHQLIRPQTCLIIPTVIREQLTGLCSLISPTALKITLSQWPCLAFSVLWMFRIPIQRQTLIPVTAQYPLNREV